MGNLSLPLPHPPAWQAPPAHFADYQQPYMRLLAPPVSALGHAHLPPHHGHPPPLPLPALGHGHLPPHHGALLPPNLCHRAHAAPVSPRNPVVVDFPSHSDLTPPGTPK